MVDDEQLFTSVDDAEVLSDGGREPPTDQHGTESTRDLALSLLGNLDRDQQHSFAIAFALYVAGMAVLPFDGLAAAVPLTIWSAYMAVAIIQEHYPSRVGRYFVRDPFYFFSGTIVAAVLGLMWVGGVYTIRVLWGMVI